MLRKRRVNPSGQHKIHEVTAPTPAYRHWNGSFMMAYSGVLYTNARPSV